MAVIVRRGPSRYSQMILWHTDTDEFEPGQWIRGNVQGFTMSADAKYAAIRVMGTRSRINSWRDTQQSIVCRPPYFTALEVVIGGLCLSTASIDRFGKLFVSGGTLVVNAKSPCPLERTSKEGDLGPPNCIDPSYGSGKGRDQRGREIEIGDGRVYVIEAGIRRVLYDANGTTLEAVEAPDWARDW